MIELEMIPLQCARPERARFYWLVRDDRNLIFDYIIKLQPDEQGQIMRCLTSAAEDGVNRRNPEQYKKIHRYQNLHEIKDKPFRLAFHELDGNACELVITVIWKKFGDRRDDLEYDRADRRWRAYLNQQHKGASGK